MIQNIFYVKMKKTFQKTVLLSQAGTKANAHAVVYSLQVNKAPFLNRLGLLELSVLERFNDIFFHVSC